MKPSIDYKELSLSDLHPDLLQKFVRLQETHKVWYKTDFGYSIKDDHFIDHWDDQKKRTVIEELRRCMVNGGTVYGALLKRDIIGFANIKGQLFGSESQYVELPYIHVSANQRGCGIGRELFELCKSAAKRNGANKLYIAAHPSVETQEFYAKMGCMYALEIDKEIYKREPLDIQMELIL